MKGKYLITTDNWFTAPDGTDYKAVWGEAKTMTAAEALGLEPNRNSANWMVRVGTEEHHILLAGCQIHYAVSCPERPNTKEVAKRYGGDTEMTIRDSQIFIPEEPWSSEKIEGIGEDDGNLERDKITTAKTFEFLKELKGLRMDSEKRREILSNKAQKIGVRFYQSIREPYYRTYNILEILWADGSETREILYVVGV